MPGRRTILIFCSALFLAASGIVWAGCAPAPNAGSETARKTTGPKGSPGAGAITSTVTPPGTSAGTQAPAGSQLNGPATSQVSDQPSTAPAGGSYALIYNGPVAATGATTAIAAVAAQDGLPVKYISNIQDLPALLPGAKVFIIGGTEDDLSPLVAAFKPEIAAALKNYLRNGGRYLGICGGGYMASTGWEEYGQSFTSLGIIPARSGSFTGGEADPRILPVSWLGQTRQMYYQDGPVFYLMPTAEQTRMIACYADGRVAAFISSYGRGEVAVSGVHPEATASWIYGAANGGAWTSSVPLAVDLLRELLR